LLQLERVEGGYGRARALHGIDLVVQKGEAVALIGANGAGKSTILRAISGLNVVSSGSIRFEGTEISNQQPRRIVRLGIAHCPEERKIWPNLSVLDHLELGATVRGRPQASDLEQIYALFPILSERRHQAAGTLSGGQQQMVAIGRALMSNPKLLLCDEISLGLAPIVIREVYARLPAIVAEGCPRDCSEIAGHHRRMWLFLLLGITVIAAVGAPLTLAGFDEQQVVLSLATAEEAV